MGEKLLGLLVLALICLSYMEAEASLCETRSREFRGLCFRNDNCASICEKEGFITGSCKGFLLRCICAKSCAAKSPGISSGGSPPDSGAPPDGGDSGAPPDSEDSGAPPDDASGGDGGAPPDGGADGSGGSTVASNIN